MKPQTQLLLLLASIAAALLMSRGVLAGAGTHAAMPVRIVEDDEVGFAEREEAAYPQRRVLAYKPEYVGYGGLEENKAACYGSCPGRGQPYTGRGCKAIFGCRGR
ncbi:hypothetical protein ZWY2020_022586 [Hordeum vulgare]|nr:hypothetical protein ZWY2020_022586 [Hordeum vulgare]